MNTIMKKVAASLMMFALVISAFNMPLISVAHAQSLSDFSFDLPGFDFSLPGLNLGGITMTSTSCNVTVDNSSVFVGGSVNLSWTTSGFSTVAINGQAVNGANGTVTMTNIVANTTYTLTASTADGSSNCTSTVQVTCLPPPVDCRLEVTKVVDKATAAISDTLVYTITVKNIGTTDCSGSGVKIEDVLSDKLTYLTQTNSSNITPGYDGGIPVYTTGDRTVHFNGNVLTPGESGSMTISAKVNAPTTCVDFDITNQAKATAKELNNFGTWAYSPVVKTSIDNDCSNPTPSCEYFTATPNTLPVGGGQTILNWKALNTTNVSIAPTIGSVSAQGSQTTNVTTNTTFVLTATDTNGHQVTCAAPVTVAPVVNDIFTCQNNVTFTASDYSITRGDNSILTWSTTGVDTVSISTIGTTALSGSRTVGPTSDTTYTLTATKGSKSVDCPLTVAVTTSGGGGGGGGSSSPRCELTISDNKISAGEKVTLKWNTTRATEVTIKDNYKKTILDTDDYASKDRSDHYDGSVELRPTRDTEYTLTASKGSKDRVCKVKVNVDDIKVITDRTPTVAGISLVNVPYTGFEAGPMLTIIFYVLLTAWALFVTYLIVIRRQPSLGNSGAMNADFPNAGMAAMKHAEALRPDVFASIAPAMPVATVPANLPVAPVVGYANMTDSHGDVNLHQVNDEVVTALENRAHSQMALLSSDAIRHFITTTTGNLERNEALDAVIAEAKNKYPLEDNWIVINEARMQNLCETCTINAIASQTAPFVPTVLPEGSSSLAEAIVTGNIVAAYEMIGHRPMFSLADAAADLDSVVRSRRGEVVTVSDLLMAETNKLSDEKIKNMINALTGALDGTYSDEASAVKMAIMKAVKETA